MMQTAGWREDQCIDIDGGSSPDGLQRHDLEFPQQRLDFGRHLRLHRAHHYILAALLRRRASSSMRNDFPTPEA